MVGVLPMLLSCIHTPPRATLRGAKRGSGSIHRDYAMEPVKYKVLGGRLHNLCHKNNCGSQYSGASDSFIN